MKIKLLEDISEKWKDWDRIEAVILVEGTFYSSDNHQFAMEEYLEDYWKNQGIDLSDESFDRDIDKACHHTDALFKEGKIHGFDLFCPNFNDDKWYLISHYRKAFESEAVNQIVNYAKEHGYILGTFMGEENLTDECFIIDVA